MKTKRLNHKQYSAVKILAVCFLIHAAVYFRAYAENDPLSFSFSIPVPVENPADTILIPEAVKVNRNRPVSLPVTARQFMLSTLSPGTQEAVFDAPPCLEGQYYIGFQLQYDLGDRKTQPVWSSALEIAFLYQSDTLWQAPLQVDMGTQTFIATTFHDTLASCDDDYRFIITKKTLTGAVPEDNIYLKVLFYKHLDDDFDPAASLTLSYSYSGGNTVASWTYTGESATAYDVEWVFIDEYDNFSGTAEQAFAFKRPVRVTTTNMHYTYQASYPSGRIWYRVRAVGYSPDYPDHRIPGHWFYGTGVPINISSHQPDKNWLAQTAFAEEGKYRKVMRYFDGTLRERQALTNLSTEGVALVNESFYDYEGRSSVKVLSVPATDGSLAYRSGFNIFQPADPVVTAHTSSIRQKFHYDNYRLEGSLLSDQAGAGAYYSAQNGHTGIHRDYIPDGAGYVYSQTEYMRDGTGRVNRQSSVGEAFRIDGPRAIRYHYGDAAPAELIRLFGSNVGAASHYKKNLMVDANGQVSVSYLDQSDRVIAAALAGDKPANVDALKSYTDLSTDPITVDISSKRQHVNGTSYISHKILNVAPNTSYTFQYDLSAAGTEMGPLGCQTCLFDVVLSLSNPDGRFLDLSSAAGNQSADPYRYERKNIAAADCVNPTLVNDIAFTVVLPDIGDYTLTKTLIPHELSYNEMETLVTQDLALLEKIQDIYDSYSIDSTACAICTACPEADAAIEEAIQEVTDRDCENIYQEIVQYYQDLYGNATEEPYEVPHDSIAAHAQYCQYQLCTKNRESEVFEKRLARVTSWEVAVSQGYNNLIDADPFYNNSSLSGSGFKNQMQNKLNDVYVGTIPYDNNGDGVQDGSDVYRGTISQVTDPDNTAYYIDERGNANVNGRHILYLDLMDRRDRMTTSDYQSALSNQRWVLYKSFYLEAKRKTKLEIPEYQHCAPAKEAQELTDTLPQTPEDIAVWGEDQGATSPVSAAELEMVVSNIAFNCDTKFSAADSTAIAGHLEAYFNNKPHNLFRLLFKADVGTDPHLVAIQQILDSYSCSLDKVSLDDPISCVGETANWIVNPLLTPSSVNCITDVTAECYPGWGVATGTPNTDPGGGTGRIFIWAYPGNVTSESIRGSFTAPLETGTKYELCFRYKVEQDAQTYTSGIADQVYFQLSRSLAFLNATGSDVAATARYSAALSLEDSAGQVQRRSLMTTTLSTCILPGAKYPDSVIIDTQAAATDKVWQGSNLSNVSVYKDTCIVFVPTQASTYFYLSMMSCSPDTYQGVNIKDLVLRKIAPRDNWIEFEGEQVCINYDTTNTTARKFSYTVDWNKEVQECLDKAAQENTQLIDLAIEKLMEEAVSRFNNEYHSRCLEGAGETLTYAYQPKEYHYTLYYYDLAGNLVQTVPPEGVKPLTPSQVNNFVAGNQTEPAHGMLTRYQYNTVNQLIWQQSPDAHESRFWYNDQGQLRLSQNAQQQKENKYSYTRYDALGRTIEVGELETDVPQATLLQLLEIPQFPEAQFYTLSDITRTYYDFPAEKVFQGFMQSNLRTRVPYTEVIEKAALDTIRTHYTYDVHGNVKALLQSIPGLDTKRMDYHYDLVSNNLNYIFYQYGKPDQFVHRYAYDADNRITEVYTSTDRFIWNREVAYRYYLHGPLARSEYGAYRVQGSDYYYTLQGWIKGVNMPYEGDPSHDGMQGSTAGKDVFAYTLGYYTGDYTPINNTVQLVDNRDQLWQRLQESMGHAGLYNGNISWMVTDLAKLGSLHNDRTRGMQAMLYQYDQLQRIRKSRSLVSYNAATGFAARSNGVGAYDGDFSYDLNGNLLTLERMNGQGATMDDFQYQYYTGTNKLREVKPVLRDTLYQSGPIETNHKVYRNITLTGTAYTAAGSNVQLNASENIFISPDFRAHETSDFYAHVLGEDEGTLMYDATGNLIADQDQGIRISWTPSGKVREVRSRTDSVVVYFRYDATGNRIEKRVIKTDTLYSTRYVRDASGNVMAVYRDTALFEQFIYGRERLGLYTGGVTEGTTRQGRRSYELSNHLGNILAVITDHIGMEQDSVWATVLQTNDYFPFGLTMAERSYQGRGYRYGFNGKEKDENGELGNTTYDYGMRIYNPSIGRFLTPDPISWKYAMLSPYQFASNSPISGIDQDGLEYENANARAKVARYGVDALEIKRVDDGWGKVQSQLYSLQAHGSSQDFTRLRETFLNSPQTITNNFYATYAPVQKASDNVLTPGDEIGIDIEIGVVPVAFKIYVRVMDVQQTDNSFKMTFATLEGHTDAGYISFSGSFDEETGEISFSIFNETRENHGAGYVSFAGRAAQIDQWEDVMGNARKFLKKEKSEVTMTENIKTYKYDESQPMGKGELVSETTKKINE